MCFVCAANQHVWEAFKPACSKTQDLAIFGNNAFMNSFPTNDADRDEVIALAVNHRRELTNSCCRFRSRRFSPSSSHDLPEVFRQLPLLLTVAPTLKSTDPCPIAWDFCFRSSPEVVGIDDAALEDIALVIK